MDEAVHHGWQECGPRRNPLDANPPEEEHGAVVVDVQEGQLSVLLPQDEEDGITELEEFGEVVPPYCIGYLK